MKGFKVYYFQLTTLHRCKFHSYRKEVHYIMEEIKLTPSMEEELSNGKENQSDSQQSDTSSDSQS